jgi:hypothetical protein
MVVLLLQCSEPEEPPTATPTCGGDTDQPEPLAFDGPPPAFSPVPVPDRFVGGYLEHYVDLLPRDLPDEYTLILFAFARVDAEGGVIFDHHQDTDALIHDISDRRHRGEPTLLSIGGTGGARSGLHRPEHRERFLADLVPIIDRYGFSGVDWNLELGMPGGPSADGMIAVSRALRDRYGDDFAITVAPYAAPEIVAAYKSMVGRAHDIVTFVGFQHYNAARPPTPDSVLRVMEEWRTECRLRADQWALGFLHRDDERGLTTPHRRMVSIYQHVAEEHPGLRGVWTWGIGTKDEPLGYPFATELGSAVALLAADRHE